MFFFFFSSNWVKTFKYYSNNIYLHIILKFFFQAQSINIYNYLFKIQWDKSDEIPLKYVKISI